MKGRSNGLLNQSLRKIVLYTLVFLPKAVCLEVQYEGCALFWTLTMVSWETKWLPRSNKNSLNPAVKIWNKSVSDFWHCVHSFIIPDALLAKGCFVRRDTVGENSYFSCSSFLPELLSFDLRLKINKKISGTLARCF